MDLRQTHGQARAFDAFLALVAVFGCAVAIRAFSAGGMWDVLGYAALVGEGLLIYGIWIEPKRCTVKTYRESLVRDPAVWIRLIFVSDLHAGVFHDKEWYARIATEVHALHPDLFLLGGDYVGDRAEPIRILQPFAGVRAALGSFFVLGNHDLLDRPEEIREALRSFGAKDLTNACCVLTTQGRSVEICGVDDHWYGNPELRKRSSPNVPHITVSHEPDVLLDLKQGDTDLVISGHTHGGQIRLPFVGALWPIPAKLGRSVDCGRKLINGVRCIVSNGLGETDGRMRLFSPPQIVVIEVGI